MKNYPTIFKPPNLLPFRLVLPLTIPTKPVSTTPTGFLFSRLFREIALIIHNV